MSNHSYGWIPDLPDKRDHYYQLRAAAIAPSVDLRPKMPPIYDQGNLGSCTANAIAGAIEYDIVKQKKPDFMPSRLFIYYCERVIEHTTSYDAGADIRDGFKAINKYGACHETEWPYDTAQFSHKPSKQCYNDAKLEKAVAYNRLMQNDTQLKGCLTDGYPFTFGFTVYESFESAKVASSGIVPLPDPSEAVLGGHAVLCVGYDGSGGYICRNSWGPDWGQAGYFLMPQSYLYDSDLSGDFWVVRTMS